MQGYILFISPALFIITAEFIRNILEFKTSMRLKWTMRILAFAFIALSVRYSIERIKPFENRERRQEWVANLKSLNKNNFKKGVLFNYKEPVMAMFYTDLTVYSTIPEKKILEDLSKQGFTVLINDQEPIPAEIKKMPEVKFISLKQPK